MAVMHVVDIVQPLIVIPYAARVLGPEQFGKFVYALSVGAIAATLVDYGFYWTGQREAAAARQDESALAKLFANIMCAKSALLLCVCIVGLCALPTLGLDRPLFLAALTTAVGNILFPAWLFIGVEQPWRAALPATASRIVLLGAFVALVGKPDDTVIATALQGGAPLLAAALSALSVARLAGKGFRGLSALSIWGQFQGGSRAFLFAVVERIVATAPLLMVTNFQGYIAAGQYSIADKFVGATRPFFRVVSETFLPRIAYYTRHAPDDAVFLFSKVCYTLVIGAGLSVFIYFAAPYVILLLFGHAFAASIPIVRLMSVIPFLLNANLLSSTLYMFNFGHEKAWGYLVALSLLVFFASAWVALTSGIQPVFAVPLALIAKELSVLAVSGTYLFSHFFGPGSAHVIRRLRVQEVQKSRPRSNPG